MAYPFYEEEFAVPYKLLRGIAALCAAVFFLMPVCAAAPAPAADLKISAKAWILFEPVSGVALLEKNSRTRLPMASTTKIMSTLLCLESGELDNCFTVDENAIKTEGSSMGLVTGDIVTKRALCTGMLLPSGNDAANAAAIAVAGSFESFAELMNERAGLLGMSDTNFVTPSGLHDKNHYSTAYDMALLTRTAMLNPDFAAICAMQSADVEFGNLPYHRRLYNTNKLLAKYRYAIGVKTGFTDEAGRCLVSCAEKDGIRLICVTLNAPDDWNDHEKLYEYGFGRMKSVKLSPQGELSVAVVGSETHSCRLYAEDISVGSVGGAVPNYRCVLRTAPFVYAPVRSDRELGVLDYYADGVCIASVPVYSAENIP